MSKSKQRETIKKAIQERITGGSIECEVAQEIASELGIDPKEVGEVAKALELNLKNCQGGC